MTSLVPDPEVKSSSETMNLISFTVSYQYKIYSPYTAIKEENFALFQIEKVQFKKILAMRSIFPRKV